MLLGPLHILFLKMNSNERLPPEKEISMNMQYTYIWGFIICYTAKCLGFSLDKYLRHNSCLQQYYVATHKTVLVQEKYKPKLIVSPNGKQFHKLNKPISPFSLITTICQFG
jgi:hypothetical protein